jgi:hypothetical protein
MFRRLSIAVLAVLFALLGAAGWLHLFAPAQAVRADSPCVQAGNKNCYPTIQSAVAAAQPGVTIRVAAGTYVEYVTITQTITLEGGWNSSFTVRDPQIYHSIIQPPDASFSVVDIEGQFSDPAAVAPVLDGFTITGGGGGNHGGGVRIRDSNAIVRNNTITGNQAYLLGGGIWVQRGAPLLEDNFIENNVVIQGGSGDGGGVELESTRATLRGNTISGNQIDGSTGYGGGVAVIGGGRVVLELNTITGNAAANQPGTRTDSGYGGGVFVQDAPVTMRHNLIQGNFANSYGDLNHTNAGGNGGGIYLLNSSDFVLSGNTIDANATAYSYLATNAYTFGGGLLITSSQGSLTDNIITNNMANRYTIFGNGGGMAVLSSTLSLQGGEIMNNKTSLNYEGYGGGVYMKDSSLTLDDVRIENNSAGNSPFYGKGGGLAFINTPYTLTNAIIAKNYAYDNDTGVGGIYADRYSPGSLINDALLNNNGQGIRTASAITVTNSILLGHTTGISLTLPVPVNVKYNNFFNNTVHQRGFPLDVTNIVIDPHLDTTYHLSPNSALIDAGTRLNAPDHDMDGEPRPMAGSSGFFRVDIGPDEVTGPAQVTLNMAKQPADFTLIGPGNPQDNPGSDGSNDWIGNAVIGGDLNGDGRDDLVAGAQNLSSDFSGGTNDDGRVFALYNSGTPQLGVVDLYTTTADLEVRSWIHQQHVGQSFAVQDINGDLYPDLIIGASGAAGFNVKGRVFIFAGGPTLSGTRTLSPTMQASYQILADQNTTSFANANELAAGQLDGNGSSDVVVGEAGATASGRDQAGQVYVFYTTPGLPPAWDLSAQPASLTFYGPAANANLGDVALADVNADGKPDLILRSNTDAYVFFGPLSSGVIDLASQPADRTLHGLQAGGLAAGDVDGDGKADLIVGSGDQVQIYRGDSLSLMATFTGVNASALATLDWNHDGKADLVIGDSLANRAFVVLGSASLSGSADIFDRADWIIDAQQPGDHLGFSVGSGDLDADGMQDLIIGSRTHVLNTRSDPHFNDAGAVYVFYSAVHYPPALHGLTGATISGPSLGKINTSYIFAAAYTPLTATLPITYTWTPAPDSGQGSSTAHYSWSAAGVYTISLTVQNPLNTVSSSRAITIRSNPPPGGGYHIHLPLIFH